MSPTLPNTRHSLPAIVVAVGAASLAQALIGTPDFRGAGWVLYVAAAALFAAQCKDLVTLRLAGGRLHDTMPANPIPRSGLFRAALMASGGTNLAALVAFALSATSGLGWGLYALSICLFLLGLLFAWASSALASARKASFSARKGRVELGLLAAILAIACIVRVWQLDRVPEGLWLDEALVGLAAERVITEAEYHPLYDLSINRPLHIAYLTAGSFAIFGKGVAALRLVTAVFGVLSVFAAYLLFDRLLGHLMPAGLIAAAFLAFMRYGITFSRIAFDGLTVPLFIMLICYLLDYGFEHKGIPAFGLAGFCLGLGLAFYQPMLIFMLILIVLGTVALAKVVWFSPGRRASLRETWMLHMRPWLPHLLFALFGFFIAFSPQAEYALFVPSKLFMRVGTASIVAEPEEPPLLVGLWVNTTRHLGMFHAEGDPNGRHNLPRAPILDPALGILVFLGTGIAIRRWREPPFLVALVSLAGMLAGGIFSASSTTPHALRVIGSIPVIVFFALVALASLKRAIEQHLARSRAWHRMVLGAAGIGLVVVIGGLNLDLYFNRQMRDPEVRFAHSLGESWVATEINRLGDTHNLLVSVHFWSHPSIRFLAPRVSSVERLWVTQALPLNVDVSRPLVLFLDPTMDEFLDGLRAAYPGCTVVNLTPSDEEHSVARAVYLSIEQLRAPHTQ